MKNIDKLRTDAIIKVSKDLGGNPDLLELVKNSDDIEFLENIANAEHIELKKIYECTEFLDKAKNDELLNRIKQSKLSDLVIMDLLTVAKIGELWQTKNNQYQYASSDILFSNTVPLLDVDIVINCKNIYSPNLNSSEFRIMIYSDYNEIIKTSHSEEPINIGIVIINIGDEEKILLPIYVKRGYNGFIVTRYLGYSKLSKYLRENILFKLNGIEIERYVLSCLNIWYGVQIALLHPVVKDIFNKPSMSVYKESKTISNKNNKKKKKVVKYIKKHIITASEIENKLQSSKYNRHTLCWYVIGHWRTYKSGKRVFIKPHWKGLLRENKNYENDIREREIVTSLD